MAARPHRGLNEVTAAISQSGWLCAESVDVARRRARTPKAYLPLKLGVRLLRKASMPSRKSSLI